MDLKVSLIIIGILVMLICLVIIIRLDRATETLSKTTKEVSESWPDIYSPKNVGCGAILGLVFGLVLLLMGIFT